MKDDDELILFEAADGVPPYLLCDKCGREFGASLPDEERRFAAAGHSVCGTCVSQFKREFGLVASYDITLSRRYTDALVSWLPQRRRRR